MRQSRTSGSVGAGDMRVSSATRLSDVKVPAQNPPVVEYAGGPCSAAPRKGEVIGYKPGKDR